MRRFWIAATAALLFAGTADAAVVSYGALSSNDDGSTEVISDSLNNVEWLRWDVLAGLDYAGTLAAISAGGAYEGWKIAGNVEAQAFTNALMDGQYHACSASGPVDYCAHVAPYNLDPLLGVNFASWANAAFFLSDNGTGREAGLLWAYDETHSSGLIRKQNEWNSLSVTDLYSDGGQYSAAPITWLLYRDLATVPVPASLPLLMAGLGGLAALSRRKRRVSV